MDEWNRTEGLKEGVKIIPLRRTGYLTLDIQIPDPHIGLEQSNASIRSRPTTTADGPPQLPHPTGISA